MSHPSTGDCDTDITREPKWYQLHRYDCNHHLLDYLQHLWLNKPLKTEEVDCGLTYCVLIYCAVYLQYWQRSECLIWINKKYSQNNSEKFCLFVGGTSLPEATPEKWACVRKLLLTTSISSCVILKILNLSSWWRVQLIARTLQTILMQHHLRLSPSKLTRYAIKIRSASTFKLQLFCGKVTQILQDT